LAPVELLATLSQFLSLTEESEEVSRFLMQLRAAFPRNSLRSLPAVITADVFNDDLRLSPFISLQTQAFPAGSSTASWVALTDPDAGSSSYVVPSSLLWPAEPFVPSPRSPHFSPLEESMMIF